MGSVPFDMEAEVEKSLGRAPTPPPEVQDERMARIRTYIDEEDLDGVLLYGDASHPDITRHLAGYVHVFHYAYTLILIPSEGPAALLMDQPWHREQAQEMSWIDDIRILPQRSGSIDHMTETFEEVFADRGIEDGRIGVLDTFLPAKLDRALQRGVPGAELVYGTNAWADYVRDPSNYDLKMLRRTAAIADEGQAAVKAGAESGRTEREVCLGAYDRMMALGSEYLHECPIDTRINIGSFSEVISNIRPYLFTNRRLEHGQMFWVDMSAQYSGYHIDCCRTISIGEPTDEQRRLYDVCAAMHDAMVEALEPGVDGQTLWDAGYDVAAEAGYGDYVNFIYFGHSTGIETTERPFAQDGESREIREGSLFNLEPGVFHPEIGSASIENTFYVTDDGVERLNQFSNDLHIV
jgi:Xaa-Pro aminopeptidase